jgi:hypothetical protein
MDITEITHAVLRSFRDPADTAEPDEDPRPSWQWEPAGPDRLPGTDRTGRVDLATTLRRRRAHRVFSATPLDQETVRATVAAGLAADRRTWPDESGCCQLEPIVVAQRIADVPLAICTVADDGLSPVVPLPSRNHLTTLTLQREFADAGVIVLVLADLDRAARLHGGHGYRLLMTRAGGLAYAMWLDGIARGLAGSVFAGFLPAAIRGPLRCDGVRRHQLFALALGLPATELSLGADIAH